MQLIWKSLKNDVHISSNIYITIHCYNIFKIIVYDIFQLIINFWENHSRRYYWKAWVIVVVKIFSHTLTYSHIHNDVSVTFQCDGTNTWLPCKTKSHYTSALRPDHSTVTIPRNRDSWRIDKQLLIIISRVFYFADCKVLLTRHSVMCFSYRIAIEFRWLINSWVNCQDFCLKAFKFDSLQNEQTIVFVREFKKWIYSQVWQLIKFSKIVRRKILIC